MTQVLKTALTELVGIEHPVVQTGMGWVAGPRLVAATSNAGGLGILASATMTLDELIAAVAKTKSLTDKPFGVNIRADAGDATERIELLIREKVKVASFALAPKQDLIAKLKDNGVVVVPSIGAAKHAKKVAAWGADAVIVQGGEGGATPARSPPPCYCPRYSTPSRTPECPSSPPAASSTDAAWQPRCRTGPQVSPWAPASC